MKGQMPKAELLDSKDVMIERHRMYSREIIRAA